MASSARYQCRGHRAWCNSRCERTTPLKPDGYPIRGYYCAVHDTQEPKQTLHGHVDAKISEIQFLQRATSWKSVADSAVMSLTEQHVPGFGATAQPITLPQLQAALVRSRVIDAEHMPELTKAMITQGLLMEPDPITGKTKAIPRPDAGEKRPLPDMYMK